MHSDRHELSFALQDYQYHLPEKLIAQAPADRKDVSRLLVLQRDRLGSEHLRFQDIGRFFRQGDLLVINNTRVVAARLHGKKDTGGAIELLVLDPFKDPQRGREEGFCCLVKSAKRPRPGIRMLLPNGVQAVILSTRENGQAMVRFLDSAPLLSLLEQIGRVPLPPYIRRNGQAAPVDDRQAYQTVYAAKPGAVAAPTAGLHFTTELLQDLQQSGVQIAEVTLHVGYGTFVPVRVEDIRQHRMHPEFAEVTADAADTIQAARQQQRRIIAVGTTVVRILEWLAAERGAVTAFSGFCNHYIYPGYQFQVINGMLTNFHLPGSSLLLLVSALAGRETILRAYREAIDQGYRFYSYGDAMLIL